MKTKKINIFSIILRIFIVPYLFFTFITWDYNIANWSSLTRIFYIISVIIFSIICFIGYVELAKTKSQYCKSY